MKNIRATGALCHDKGSIITQRMNETNLWPFKVFKGSHSLVSQMLINPLSVPANKWVFWKNSKQVATPRKSRRQNAAEIWANN
jgi:hypothetical protein